MSEIRDAARNATGETKDEMEMMGVQFIDLVEITDVPEGEASGEHGINAREELRKRLCKAENCFKSKRKLYDEMLGNAQTNERLIIETTEENKYLSNKVKGLQQQVADIRKAMHLQWEREDEEVLRQERLSQEESFVMCQVINIKKVEKQNHKLREKNKALTAELDQLSLGKKYKEATQNLRRREQELKLKLEEVQEVLRSKDEEIEKKSMTLTQKESEIEEYFSTIEDLKQDQRKLRKQANNRKKLLHYVEIVETVETPLPPPPHDRAEPKEPTPNVFGWCAKGLWKGKKAAGAIAVCILVPVGVMASMVPVCRCPDRSLWDIAFDLLDPYCELYHTVPTAY